MKRFVATFSVLMLLAVAAAAQSVRTPERGSAERKAILDAIRVPVERDMKQKIVFVTDEFRVYQNWAFVSGTLQTPDGGQPDLRGTAWAEEADFFENNFFALVRKTGTRWRVTTNAIGCTDVCYADWWRRYRAPKAVFPYTE
ncbi:MAG: hypothetical protein IPM21_06410 [Acidobacteria bacterium]|nr:hypothetical protein [Acidobacteriota bacterium]